MNPFDDDTRFAPLDETEAAPAPTSGLALLAQQLESRFTSLGPWIKQGLCTDPAVDRALFDGIDEETAGTPRELATRQRDAARLCAACPVRVECLADARDNEATIGTIRGGVLFAAGTSHVRTEHNLIDLLHRGLLIDSPAGRGRTAASAAA